jgi:hypothetical protein
LKTAPADGDRLKCPECSAKFKYAEPDDEEAPPAKKSKSKSSGISANPPARQRRDRDESDDEEQEEPKPAKKKKPEKAASKTGLIIGLVAGVGVLAVLGIAVVAVVALVFLRDRPVAGPELAKAKDPQQVVADPANPPAKDQGVKPKDPVVAPPPPVLQPKDPVIIAPLPPKAAPKPLNPAELYGEQGGEKVSPADAGLPGAVMRARKDDTFIKLSNPRVGQVKAPGPKGKGVTLSDALLIDYVVVRRGKFDGGMLVVHTDDGQRAEIAVNDLKGRDQGTIELVGVSSSGMGFFKKTKVNAKTEFPQNIEFYATRDDNRYRPLPKFMVSNTAVMGVMKVKTVARDWTLEEQNNYGRAPLAYLAPNYHPDSVGQDVPALNGWPWKNRWVDPESRLLGVDFRNGEWAGQKRIGALGPVFSPDQPPAPVTSREIAKQGYAVAGAEVHYDKDKAGVYGIRMLYRRVRPDGMLDAKDAYAGEWIGAPPVGPPTVLVNDGRHVIGMNCQNGAVIDRVALVVAK